MNKLEFFLAAMRAEEFRRRAWVISAFSLIREDAEEWKKDPYPYRIVQTPAGYFFVDPDKDRQLSPIDGVKAGEPPFSVKEKTLLPAFGEKKFAKPLETTYGRILFNYTVLYYPFKNKLEYVDRRIKPSEVEEMILPKLRDTPAEGEERKQELIYVDEYLNFCDAMFYLASFTQICVPAGSKKSMTAAPGIKELRKKLFEENKDRLHDPAVIAMIDAELVKYDREYMKGDPAEGFLINGKSWNIVRKKMFGMHGAEMGLSESVSVELIPNSLSEGWDVSKFPVMNNSLRIGSFNRGHQTMMGGESVKWLLRASSNINITKDDCGSRLGNPITVDGKNYSWLIGFHVITPQGSDHVPDEEAAKKYIGKDVLVRSPMYCKLDKTDYCSTCCGSRLAENPTGLSVAISEYGSTFLDIYMSAAHAKALLLAKMDYKTAIT